MGWQAQTSEHHETEKVLSLLSGTGVDAKDHHYATLAEPINKTAGYAFTASA